MKLVEIGKIYTWILGFLLCSWKIETLVLKLKIKSCSFKEWFLMFVEIKWGWDPTGKYIGKVKVVF